MDKEKNSVSPKHLFLAIVIVFGTVTLVFFLVFGIDWRPTPLALEQLNADIDSEEFNNEIEFIVNSKNLKACEEKFLGEIETLACFMEAVPQAWLIYNDSSLCDKVSQTAFSQPINFAGDFLFDNHSACITLLSLGAKQDFCDQAVNPLSQASCQHIIRKNSI
jgi:hypothetical protein